MSDHVVCLNIHYSAPDEIWEKVNKVFQSMDYYNRGNDCLTWHEADIELYTSTEPGGIQISGEMPDEIWDKWYPELKSKLTEALGYEIGEPENGFAFKYWKPFVKNHNYIKSIDKEHIVFKDLSTFTWSDFTDFERDITANPPFFRFSSPLIELKITVECSGFFAKKAQRDEFHELHSKLNALGIHTLDLS
ncbi:MAG: hypothetical protein J5723_00580 [Ruminococcus sp.]|nr:hypothetical protein [Ruminococcus sp.]